MAIHSCCNSRFVDDPSITTMKLIRYCILPLSLVFTAFAQKKPSYTPDQAVARMKLPEGFSVTQFAAEPDVVQPFAFCFDDRGRCGFVKT